MLLLAARGGGAAPFSLVPPPPPLKCTARRSCDQECGYFGSGCSVKVTGSMGKAPSPNMSVSRLSAVSPLRVCQLTGMPRP